MNLKWNPELRRFEAEFSDFQSDLAAVKEAGFKTDGPPGWTWYSLKAAPLGKLKGRPGLTITPEAKTQFVTLNAVEERNAEVKAQLAVHTKALKKKLTAEKQQATAKTVKFSYFDEEAGVWIDPPKPPDSSVPRIGPAKYIPPPPPIEKCIVCKVPVYFYEQQNPPACLWCSKIVLDNSSDVC